MRSRKTIAVLASISLAACGGGAPTIDADVFVSNLAGNSVTVLRGPSLERVTEIAVEGGPHGMTRQPDAPRLWTANLRGDTVSVIDTATLRVLRTIRVCKEPEDVAFWPATNEAFVACGNGYMDVIDTRTLTRTDRQAIGFGPHVITTGPGSRLWAVNRGSNDISEIDPASNELVRRSPAGPFAYGLAFTPDGDYAFVTSKDWSSVVVIAMASKRILGAIKVGTDPALVTVSPDGTRVYVTSRGDGTLSVIDAYTFQVIETVKVGRGPDGLTISPDGRIVLVANNGGNSVSVVDTRSARVLRTVAVGRGPSDVEIVPRDR